jgi:hypothetical protein
MSLTVAERNFNTVLSLSSIVSMPASGSKDMLLFLTKECGRTTVQQERGTDDRGSFAILTAIRRASSLVSSLAAERRLGLSSKNTYASGRYGRTQQRRRAVLRRTRAAGSGELA